MFLVECTHFKIFFCVTKLKITKCSLVKGHINIKHVVYWSLGMSVSYLQLFDCILYLSSKKWTPNADGVVLVPYTHNNPLLLLSSSHLCCDDERSTRIYDRAEGTYSAATLCVMLVSCLCRGNFPIAPRIS